MIKKHGKFLVGFAAGTFLGGFVLNAAMKVIKKV